MGGSGLQDGEADLSDAVARISSSRDLPDAVWRNQRLPGFLDLPDTVWEIVTNASIEGVEHFRDSVSGIPFTTVAEEVLAGESTCKDCLQVRPELRRVSEGNSGGTLAARLLRFLVF